MFTQRTLYKITEQKKSMNRVVVQEKDFDLTAEVDFAKKNSGNIGATVSFIGTVRDLQCKSLHKMTLEHYPLMTEKALNTIVSQAQIRWKLGAVTLIHRTGELLVHEQIVLVITTSKHRKSAFEACEFIVDYLKTQAPFWKKEYTKTTSKWVVKKNTDENQLKRWD